MNEFNKLAAIDKEYYIEIKRKTNLSNKICRLLVRDGENCWLCNQRMLLTKDVNHALRPTIDHVVELRNNGPKKFYNLKLAHKYCNNSREKWGKLDNFKTLPPKLLRALIAERLLENEIT